MQCSAKKLRLGIPVGSSQQSHASARPLPAGECAVPELEYHFGIFQQWLQEADSSYTAALRGSRRAYPISGM